MSVILWCALIGYLVVCVVFNLAMLSFYQDEKDATDSLWTGNELADKTGIFLCSALWPIPLLIGLIKMKGENK